MKTFEELGVSPEIRRAIEEMGYACPMPVQEEVIPYLLGENNDVVALAQTGTGKTAAFGLPLIQQINVNNRIPQSLILCPTRELCLQIAGDLNDYSKYIDGLRVLPVYGGSSIESQIRALKRGVHIIVATPGRLLDLMERKTVSLSTIQNVVMDEADEMLNMGFTDSINAILADVPQERNTLLFSATMSPEIARISKKYLHNAKEITIGRRNEGTSNVKHVVFTVHAKDKYAALKRIVDYYPQIYGIIFCRTRKETQEIADKLMQEGYNADSLHGELSQAQRDAVMQKSGVEKGFDSFLKEARKMAKLRSIPSVVGVNSVFIQNETAYIVMDFIEGETLLKKLQREGPMDYGTCVSLMTPIMQALSEVHKHGIIHRDISPDNIMITHDRKVKLIDFGAARMYGNYNYLRVQKGGYSPIEQVTPGAQIGPYSDVYALCATMYTCMTGVKVPHAVERAKQDRLVPPSAMGLVIAPQEEAVLMQGLAIDPAQRYANAEQLYQALYETSMEQTGSVSMMTHSGISQMLADMQADRKKQAHRKKQIGMVCGIVLLLGIGTFIYFQRTRNGDETTAASEATTQQILQTEIDASPVEEVDCTAYAQEFYDLCAKQHEAKGNTLTQRDEFTVAAKETAAKSAALVYTSMDELNAALTEIGNQAIATYKIPNTGWVTYTFSLKEDVATVKQALDTYIAQMNEENQGTVDLDNCAYLGVSVARAQDGTYFWAVFYQ